MHVHSFARPLERENLIETLKRDLKEGIFLSVYKGKQPPRLEEALNTLAAGFLRGGTGFLKSSAAGEMIKGSGTINREIRVGVTHVSCCIVTNLPSRGSTCCSTCT